MHNLSGKNANPPHQTLYWRFGDQWAIRHGNFKLVAGNGGGPMPGLYDLANDVGESKDLAVAQPEKGKELLALWQKWNVEQAPPVAPKNDNTKKKAANRKTKKAKTKSADAK